MVLTTCYEILNRSKRNSIFWFYSITYKLIKRFGGIWYFYSLFILLLKLLNKPDRIFIFWHFYNLFYPKHWKAQIDSSIFYLLTALLFVINLDWVVTIDMEYILSRFLLYFDLYALLVWFSGFINTIILRCL